MLFDLFIHLMLFRFCLPFRFHSRSPLLSLHSHYLSKPHLLPICLYRMFILSHANVPHPSSWWIQRWSEFRSALHSTLRLYRATSWVSCTNLRLVNNFLINSPPSFICVLSFSFFCFFLSSSGLRNRFFTTSLHPPSSQHHLPQIRIHVYMFIDPLVVFFSTGCTYVRNGEIYAFFHAKYVVDAPKNSG